jgi:hypothetical protein
MQGVVRGSGGIERSDTAPSFRNFRKGFCCVQGVVKEAVEELREQLQRHLYQIHFDLIRLSNQQQVS